MSFVDECTIEVFAGNGGNGCSSFRRAKFRPNGGPDGGDGGNGGSIVLVARDHTRTLYNIAQKLRYRADDGDKGSNSTKTGKDGATLFLEVPLGTLVRNAATGELIADLDEQEKSFVVAQGGIGGFGNKHFTTATNQAPTETSKGTEGQHAVLDLEVKLIADVGLVGFPNAGKSTLLGNISGAKPKTGAYPFTTIKPHLGMVALTPEINYVVADIPGLIEGAHEGKGMGVDFLKHIERTRLLLHLVDPFVEDVDALVEKFRAINHELSSFSETLAKKPQIVVLTKAECLDEGTTATYLAALKEVSGRPTFAISALARMGLKELFKGILKYDRNPS